MPENAEVQIKYQEFRLEPDSELRFEVQNKNDRVVLEMKTGLAEIFGTELVKGKFYTFYFGAKIVVFSWQGCTLELCGKKVICYITNNKNEMPMLPEKSKNENTQGPITMIVGPADIAKSTFCNILLNCSARMISSDRKPIYVNLNPSQGQISVPEIIGAVMIERPAVVNEHFSQTTPQIYHYKHTKLKSSILYNILVSRMVEVILQRMDYNSRIKDSGIIMNTYGWVNGKGYQHLIYIALAFEIDVIIVLSQERLYSELSKNVPVSVFMRYLPLLPKSGKNVERSKKFRSEDKKVCIHKYFYGTPMNILYPHTYEMKFSDMKVFKIGVVLIPNTPMPLDIQKTDLKIKLEPITPGSNMLHHVLALNFITTIDITSIAGFVCVTNVDTSREILTLLSSQPKQLPETIYLMLDIQFMNSNT